jgi:hypothetical protein
VKQPRSETIAMYTDDLRHRLTPRQAQRRVYRRHGQAEAFRIAEWARQRLIAAGAFESSLTR